MNKKYLTYEEFGAIGDGKNDDFAAIIACHEEANRTGTPVKARDDATYYIGGKDAVAIIKTDVDFGTSKIVIDDRNVERNGSYVFSIESDYVTVPIELDSIKKGQKKIAFSHIGNVFVRVFDDNHKVYIRKGLNRSSGTATADVFCVDKDGNVYPSIDFDYPSVTRADMRCTDDKPITIKGGIFTTIANHQESYYRYLQRGFQVSRAHVTICNFEHYVEGELEQGAPYHGFIRANYAVDLTIRDAVMTPRFIYWTASKIPGKPVPMGSYDLSFFSSIDVRCINITQTIDILDTKYWGIYTSNFCKNLYLENCTFSRFDAHMGVTNATIKNCTLGHQHIQLIGHGEFLMENTLVKSFASNFLYLRCDYGSNFDGNITIRNCEWETTANNIRIIGENNEGDHDFGYPCYYGKNITVDGLKIRCNKEYSKEEMSFTILSDAKGANPELPFAYNVPKSLTLSGIETDNGLNYVISYSSKSFADMKISEK